MQIIQPVLPLGGRAFLCCYGGGSLNNLKNLHLLTKNRGLKNFGTYISQVVYYLCSRIQIIKKTTIVL